MSLIVPIRLSVYMESHSRSVIMNCFYLHMNIDDVIEDQQYGHISL